MAEEAPKSWWQTMAGVMTGVAALLTASAGLIAALNKAGFIGRPEQSNAAPPPQSSLPGLPDTERPPAGRVKLDDPAKRPTADKPVNPASNFMEIVPPGESRERGLRYIIPSMRSHAVLRIVVGLSNAEIPLSLPSSSGAF